MGNGVSTSSQRPEKAGLSLIAITDRQTPFAVLQEYSAFTRVRRSIADLDIEELPSLRSIMDHDSCSPRTGPAAKSTGSSICFVPPPSFSDARSSGLLNQSQAKDSAEE